MAIGFIEMQGQITTAPDYTTIKHHEDNKVVVEQANFVQQMEKQLERQTSRVNQGEQVDYYNRQFDAKEKGDNEYQGDGGRNRKKHSKFEEDGKVLLKGVGNYDVSL